MPITRDLVAADHAHLLHPLHHPSLHKDPKVWVEGRGATVTDADGRQYLDGLAGLWNVNVGHGRRELADAAMAQMSTLAYASSYAGSTNFPAIELAERLSEVTYPSINTFYFTSGGAEATDSSIKTARFYWKAIGRPDKTKIISRRRGYHGLTLAAMSATGIPAFWPMFEPRVPGFVHIDAPDPYRFVSDDPAVTIGVAAANQLEGTLGDARPAVRQISGSTLPEAEAAIRDLRATTRALRQVTEKIDEQGAGALVGGSKLPDYKP